MSSNVLGFVEMLLIFGVVLGLAGYELWALRRDRLRSEKVKAASKEKVPPA